MRGQKVRNITLFLVGCLLASGALIQLQGAGRAWAALGSIERKATQAYQQVGVAQTALAETKFDASEQAFGEAAQSLQQARQELDDALASSKYVLRALDVTGTVRSSEELLTAAAKVTEAGEHVSKGIKPLFNVNPLQVQPGRTLIDAINTAQPELAAAAAALAGAERSLKQVTLSRVPETIRPSVEQLQQLVPRARQGITAFLDQTGLLLTFLGEDHERQYLIVFENNNELRPTGGFIGSLAVVNIDRGVVEAIDVKSVYDPDGQLQEFIAPPDPLSRITPRWYLRDANWFVNYPTSARKLADFLEKEKGPTVDGVIAMTPEVIRQLLTVTGPITLPSYDVTVSADNFVALTQDEVTYKYDRALNHPKQFLADLTPLLLNRLISSPEKSLSQGLGVLTSLLAQKHLLLYFRDSELQQQVVVAGWGGALPTVTPTTPTVLSVNNANIGGHKSDQFVEQELDYRVEVNERGVLDAYLTIRRTHRGPEEKGSQSYPPGEDPATKDNIVYQRVLVPLGAQLLEAHGFSSAADIPQQVKPATDVPLTADPDVAEWQRQQTVDATGTASGQEAGYAFFANWMVTAPGQTTVGFYHYRLPGPAALPTMLKPYQQWQTQLIKQPGDVRTTARVEVRLPKSMRIVHAVPHDGATQDEQNMVYRGALSRDRLVGIVYGEK